MLLRFLRQFRHSLAAEHRYSYRVTALGASRPLVVAELALAAGFRRNVPVGLQPHPGNPASVAEIPTPTGPGARYESNTCQSSPDGVRREIAFQCAVGSADGDPGADAILATENASAAPEPTRNTYRPIAGRKWSMRGP